MLGLVGEEGAPQLVLPGHLLRGDESAGLGIVGQQLRNHEGVWQAREAGNEQLCHQQRVKNLGRVRARVVENEDVNAVYYWVRM